MGDGRGCGNKKILTAHKTNCMRSFCSLTRTPGFSPPCGLADVVAREGRSTIKNHQQIYKKGEKEENREKNRHGKGLAGGRLVSS